MNVPDFIKNIVYSRTGVDPDGNVFGMQLNEAEDNLEIRRKWRGFRLPPLFIAVSCTFVSFLIASELLWPEDREITHDRSDLIIALIILPPVGLCSGYAFFCHLINSTRIIADSETIRIEHGPLLYLGNKSVTTNLVKGIEVKKNGGTGDKRRSYQQYYQVVYCERSGSIRTLVSSGAINKYQAEYIKQNLARFLQTLT